jgi:hypothetical protein
LLQIEGVASHLIHQRAELVVRRMTFLHMTFMLVPIGGFDVDFERSIGIYSRNQL